MEKLLIVDGMALLFRHYFATAMNHHFMHNSDGVPTNGVQGFIRHVASAIKDSEADHVIVTWDMGATTFRNTISADYKAHRPAPPVELNPQFEMVQRLSEELGFFNIGVRNYEADDVIGTIAKQLEGEYRITVISGDRDLLQLLDDRVEIWLIKKGFTEYNKYDVNRFREEYGIEPPQLIDVKAFMGDTSDGYPGVKGIGEKTALKFIQTYGSVDGTLQHKSQLPKGQQNKIDTFYDDLMISCKLAAIHTTVPLDLEHIRRAMPYTADIEKMCAICDSHELKVASSYLMKL
ncbi:5'-3' exonuclease [Macrococcus equipercicus]|uniref:5'-3' exonuclease n=1 Tax=Macrococcus equipercicus TaxID=69967 RepID=A0ABQ6RAB1_9STAP|nr:5'-3' exonuclease [Macrococcus equipercicus]KAA1040217.1 5'-3' exonuclease [Macrococcus equipercicus]